MIITIDGPAGVGKSSVARIVAEKMGLSYLDTGAMYRCVTWAVLKRGVDPNDWAAAADVAAETNIRFEGDQVFVDPHNVTVAIRSDEVTANVSPIADNPKIRERLVNIQREFAAQGKYICEGRDQGTVVFPDAVCKIFLVASAEERAARRVRQLVEAEIDADFESILAQQNERDQRDYDRPVGKLIKAPDAVEVITDNNSLEEVSRLLIQIIREKIAERDQSNSLGSS